MAIDRILPTAIHLPKNDLKCERPVARQQVLGENLEAE